MALTAGNKAPPFSLTDKEGVSHSLEGETGGLTVLYFYPKDDTPGCTIEAKDFSEQKAAFDALNVRVFGISGGDDASKKEFCDKHGLTVALLSDPDFKVAGKYGVYGEKSQMGRSYMGIHRTTFLVGADGVIRRTYENVKAEGHAAQVLADVQALAEGRPLMEAASAPIVAGLEPPAEEALKKAARKTASAKRTMRKTARPKKASGKTTRVKVSKAAKPSRKPKVKKAKQPKKAVRKKGLKKAPKRKLPKRR